MHKVIPPKQTFETTLRKVQGMKFPILDFYFDCSNPVGIPLFRFEGNEYFFKIAKFQEGANGKGHTKDQALASGIMELVERYSCFKYLNEHASITSSFKDSQNNAFTFETFYLNYIHKKLKGAGLRINDLKNAKIRWYKGHTLSGKEVYAPLSLIFFMGEGTNGWASGNTFEEALVQAICEVIERHCLRHVKQSKLNTPSIDISSINSPVAKELISKFQLLGQEVLVKDFSLGIGLPVIGVVRIINETFCIVTAGVATSPEEALIRALTENAQTEGKSNFINISGVLHYFKNDKIISMKNIPCIEDNNLRMELERIKNILHEQNLHLYFFDATDPELNIPAVIVVIPQINKTQANYLSSALVEESLAAEEPDYLGIQKYLSIFKNTLRSIKYPRISHKEYKRIKGLYLYRRGRLLIYQKYYSRAIRCFREALKLTKTDNRGLTEIMRIQVLINSILCYKVINKTNKAINYYVKLIDLSRPLYIKYFRFCINLNKFLKRPINKNIPKLLGLKEIKVFFAKANLSDFSNFFTAPF